MKIGFIFGALLATLADANLPDQMRECFNKVVCVYGKRVTTFITK